MIVNWEWDGTGLSLRPIKYFWSTPVSIFFHFCLSVFSIDLFVFPYFCLLLCLSPHHCLCLYLFLSLLSYLPVFIFVSFSIVILICFSIFIYVSLCCLFFFLSLPLSNIPYSPIYLSTPFSPVFVSLSVAFILSLSLFLHFLSLTSFKE